MESIASMLGLPYEQSQLMKFEYHDIYTPQRLAKYINRRQ